MVRYSDYQTLLGYKDELLKIAEAVGEKGDPFAAWEAIDFLLRKEPEPAPAPEPDFDQGRSRIQRLHAGISRRDWYEVEQAANAIRDAFDKAEIERRIEAGKASR
jgi:hypothetical protein